MKSQRMRIRTTLGLFPFVLLLAPPLGAQSSLAPRLAALADSLRTFVGTAAPGVAVGIVRDGEILHTTYAGEADLSHHVAIGPTSRFNIASNAKQFTAAVILSLLLDGRLALNTNVKDLLPNALPLVDDAITVRQLLTHTSGLRDVYDLWSLAGTTWWRSFLGNDDALALLKQQRALNFAPDSQYLYSNSNYILLTGIVRAATDSSFAQVSEQRFKAWGLSSTGFFTRSTQVIPDRTRPYGSSDNGWQEYPSVATLHGDGNLYTTLPDQLAWEVRLQRAQSQGAAASLERLSQAPVNHASTQRYGFGIEFDTYRGVPYVFHDGSTGAYNATFLRFPEQRIAVVVMSNNGNLGVHALALQYANALLEGETQDASPYPGVPRVISAPVDQSLWLGDYRASSGTLITLARTDSGFVRRIAGGDVALLPDTGNVYRYASNPDLKMALDRDSAGQPQFTIYLPTQAPIVGRRLPPRPTIIQPAAWIGRYVNAETGAAIVISGIDGERVSASVGGWSGTGTVVRPDLVVVGSYELEPRVGSSGEIHSLLLNGGRIKRVLFTRVP